MRRLDMGRTGYAAVVIVLTALLAGCGVGPIGDDEPDVDITGDWTFESGRTDDGELSTPLSTQVTLSFDGEQGGGFGACNTYGGKVDLEGDDLRFGDINQTLRGCVGSVGIFESAYLSALPEVRHVARDGDRLTLTGEGGQPLRLVYRR